MESPQHHRKTSVCARCARMVHCVPLSCSGFLQAQNRQIDKRGGQEGKEREVRRGEKSVNYG